MTDHDHLNIHVVDSPDSADSDDDDEFNQDDFNNAATIAIDNYRHMKIDKPVLTTPNSIVMQLITTPSAYLLGELADVNHQLTEKTLSEIDLKNKVELYISTLRDKWLINSPHKLNFVEWNALINRNFGLLESDTTIREVMGSPSTAMVSSVDIVLFMETYLIGEVFDARCESERLNMVDNYKEELDKILGIIYYAASFLKNLMCIQTVSQNGLDCQVMDFSIIGCKYEDSIEYPDDNKSQCDTPYILDYIERKLIENDFRKIGEDLYCKIYTPTGNFTRAWRKVKTLKAFIYSICSRQSNVRIHRNFNHTPHRPESIIKTIRENQGGILQDIERSRYLFSFKNGIYFSNYKFPENQEESWDIFIPYEKIGKYLAPNMYSSKYFDVDFKYYLDPDLLECHPETYADLYGESKMPIANDWFHDIPTPHIQSILAYQFESEPDEKENMQISRTHYMCIGRWCYPIGEHDDWQIVLMIKGIGGTGKSTILNAMHMFWDHRYIGTISNDTEQQFGMYPLADKFGNLGMDLNSTFKMSATNFQSMITGEPMSLAVKNFSARQMEKWTASTMLAGNTNLGFSDTNGAIPRRMVESIFSKAIPKERINDKLNKIIAQTEIPAFIHKSIRAYLTTVRRNVGSNFWKFCPKYFWTNRVVLSGLSNSITRFCNDKDHIMIGNDKYVPKELFIASYNAFCIKNNIERRQFISDNYMESFETIKASMGVNLHVKTCTLRYPRPAADPTVVEGGVKLYSTYENIRELSCDFIMGLDIKAQDYT